IKYYSGPATYRTEFQVSNPQSTVVLDLGEVHEIAEVRVNGKTVGTVWKRPYTLDISGAVKRGTNTLEVTVVNTWLNRLVGDEQPGVKNRVTSTTVKTWKAKTPLQPAGLLGPVRLQERK
ncbi:MAG: glycoside hydrolase, partial [Pirellulales bacterium]|nr:glycoside hydrolase [Pirellulales bacterium]